MTITEPSFSRARLSIRHERTSSLINNWKVRKLSQSVTGKSIKDMALIGSSLAKLKLCLLHVFGFLIPCIEWEQVVFHLCEASSKYHCFCSPWVDYESENFRISIVSVIFVVFFPEN